MAYLLSGWVTTKKWAQEHAAVTSRFVAAIAEASKWANGHHGASEPILAKYTKIAPAVIAQMHRGAFAESWSDALVQPEIDAAVKFGRIKSGFPAAEMYYSVR